MAPRRPYVAGNWKMFKGPAETAAFAAALAARATETTGVKVAVAPPFPSLGPALDALAGTGIAVLAQNAHWASTGAFTGEVAAEMLAELGVDGAIVGHSERRQHFGDTDDTVARRIAHVLEVGLEAIACVGELEEERVAGRTEDVLRRQVGTLAEAVGAHERLTLAYEPVWAIGTGRTATPDQAQEAHALIRGLLDVPILYGGSVKPENAAELLGRRDVDGALVGGASLEIDTFLAICTAAPGR
ncbi:MAG: triose-phosphate isomerase [Gaiellales bacterium]